MKTLAILFVLALTPTSVDEDHDKKPATTGPEEAARCMGVKPICSPGKHPICICESDISFNCVWICAS